MWIACKEVGDERQWRGVQAVWMSGIRRPGAVWIRPARSCPSVGMVAGTSTARRDRAGRRERVRRGDYLTRRDAVAARDALLNRSTDDCGVDAWTVGR